MNDEDIARISLGIGAVKLNPQDPFQWASGYRMPIYNDNRMLMFDPKDREVVVSSFYELTLKNFGYSSSDVIAGTATAGIPWGAWVADYVDTWFVYIRDKPKDHGLKNRIEGIAAEKDLIGRRAIVIEDLISTGGSSASAVQAVRDAGAECKWCFSIFDYGFEEANAIFRGEAPYNNEKAKLTYPCNKLSLVTYDTLLRAAKRTGYIDEKDEEVLKEWREDPFGWGEKHGFSKVERK